MALFGPPDVSKLRDKQDVTGLTKALGYKKDENLRWRAAYALSEIGDARVVEPLISALTSDVGLVRHEAAEALGKIGDARAVEPLIAALTSDVGCPAAEALGKIGDTRAVEPLIAALTSDACFQATEALGKIGDARAVEPLIAALTSKVRMQAIEALGKIGDARAVKPIIAAIGENETISFRMTVTAALGKMGVPAVEPLIAALKDQSEDVRCCAVDVLGMIGDARAVEPLIAFGKNEPSMRWRATTALNQIRVAAAEPLRRAVAQGDRQEVRKLVGAGIDVNTPDARGSTVLFGPVDRGDTEMTALLLDLGADANLPVDELRQTVLHHAAYKGHTKIAALLLEAGADIEAQDKDGATPLRNTAYYGRVETGTLLLDRGANVNAPDHQGRTPLHWAAEQGRREMAAVLLDKGADVNARDVHGRTPLADAAWDPSRHGCTEVAALLLDRGADVNARDMYSKTPLNRAEEFGHPDTAVLLKQRGAVG